MIRLHHAPGTAAVVLHLLLEEIGVPYERVPVDRLANGHKTPQYLQLNPNGLIPVLTDGALVLYETAAITLHLCDTNRQSALAPARRRSGSPGALSATHAGPRCRAAVRRVIANEGLSPPWV